MCFFTARYIAISNLENTTQLEVEYFTEYKYCTQIVRAQHQQLGPRYTNSSDLATNSSDLAGGAAS